MADSKKNDSRAFENLWRIASFGEITIAMAESFANDFEDGEVLFSGDHNALIFAG